MQIGYLGTCRDLKLEAVKPGIEGQISKDFKWDFRIKALTPNSNLITIKLAGGALINKIEVSSLQQKRSTQQTIQERENANLGQTDIENNV